MSETATDLIKLLAALRDAALRAAEAIGAYLEAQAPPEVRAEGLREGIPQDLRALLDFRIEGNALIIKPRGYLGPGNFGRVMAIARQRGGRYVSAGRGSRFEIPLSVKE
jgi:hypothetical protein